MTPPRGRLLIGVARQRANPPNVRGGNGALRSTFVAPLLTGLGALVVGAILGAMTEAGAWLRLHVPGSDRVVMKFHGIDTTAGVAAGSDVHLFVAIAPAYPLARIPGGSLRLRISPELRLVGDTVSPLRVEASGARELTVPSARPLIIGTDRKTDGIATITAVFEPSVGTARDSSMVHFRVTPRSRTLEPTLQDLSGHWDLMFDNRIGTADIIQSGSTIFGQFTMAGGQQGEIKGIYDSSPFLFFFSRTGGRTDSTFMSGAFLAISKQHLTLCRRGTQWQGNNRLPHQPVVRLTFKLNEYRGPDVGDYVSVDTACQVRL